MDRVGAAIRGLGSTESAIPLCAGSIARQGLAPHSKLNVFSRGAKENHYRSSFS